MTVFTLLVIGTGCSLDTSTSEAEESQEAEDAGYQMSITSDYWLYPYMINRNNDGMAEEQHNMKEGRKRVKRFSEKEIVKY